MTPTAAAPSNPSELAASAAVLTDWLSQGAAIAPAPSAVTPAIPVDERRLLRFALQADDTALLPLASIQEVLQIPKRGVLRVPEMASPILGVSNCRGAILWLVDLALLLGREMLAHENQGTSWQPLERNQQCFSTITICAAGQSVGLVVPQLMDIETHDAKQIQPPNGDLFASDLVPFLAGYLADSRSPILSASALIEQLRFRC